MPKYFDTSHLHLPKTSVEFQTADPLWQRVYNDAVATEKNNIRAVNHPCGKRNVLIEGGCYRGIWIETQPMGGEMYAKRNMEVALHNQLFFMEQQNDLGRYPADIMFDDKDDIHPDYRHFQGLCFPFHAVNMYYHIGKDKAYLDFLADSLAAYDDYLWKYRDSDGDGCLETWCLWDTGEDECTRFLGGPNFWEGESAPYGQARLPYESMDVMGYSYETRAAMAQIEEIRGNQAEADLWRAKAAAVADKIRSYLWREDACYDRDCDNQFLPTLMHNNLRLMYHGAFSQDMADLFVKKHLLNPAEFWTPMPLPSIAISDPLFRNEKSNCWSGQPEGLTYQRAIRALENYGWDRLLPALGHKLCGALGKNDPALFTQQFDPFTGVPSVVESKDYGPTILAFLEYTAHLYGVCRERDCLVFRMGEAGYWEYTQRWDEHRYTLVGDGAKGICLVDGKEVGRIQPGEKLVVAL